MRDRMMRSVILLALLPACGAPCHGGPVTWTRWATGDVVVEVGGVETTAASASLLQVDDGSFNLSADVVEAFPTCPEVARVTSRWAVDWADVHIWGDTTAVWVGDVTTEGEDLSGSIAPVAVEWMDEACTGTPVVGLRWTFDADAGEPEEHQNLCY